MSTKLIFLGVAGYLIETDEHRVLIDPCLTAHPYSLLQPDQVPPLDAILVTHAAFDHFGDTYEIAARTGAPVICGGEVKALLIAKGIPEHQVRAIVWGLVTRVSGMIIRPVECHHWSQTTLPDGQIVSGVPMGFIVEPEPGVRIYHYGDTAIFSDLRLIKDLYQPTIGLLGCTQPQHLLRQVTGPGEVLTGEMSAREAALAAEFLGLDIAVACHYLSLEQEATERQDVQEFLAAVHEFDTTGKRTSLALEIGEALIIEGNSYRKERAL